MVSPAGRGTGDHKPAAGPEFTSAACTDFLQWALPRLGMRWAGFRRVRGQVCKRLRRRLAALGLADLAAYRNLLVQDGAEWRVLDGLTRITVSRFYRNRGVFDHLRAEILPVLGRALRMAGESRLRCLCLGCCGGEEPYTLSMVWRLDLSLRCPGVRLEIVATDSDPGSLARAAEARYSGGSLKDLPPEWQTAAFDVEDGAHRLRSEFRRDVLFLQQDLREDMPPGPFHLVLCRNLAFTYFDERWQQRIANGLAARMPTSGVLVLGSHERLPSDVTAFRPISTRLAIYQRA